MKKLLPTIALLLLTSCSESTTFDAFSDITGTVIDVDSNEAVQGVSVTLSPTGKSAVTGTDGYFEFLDLEAKQYTIIVQKTGYSSNRKTINATAGETHNLTVTIEKGK